MPFGLNRTVLDVGCTRVDHPKRYRCIFFSTQPCHAMHISFFLFLPLISSFSVSRFESASFDCSYCNKDRDGDTSYFFFYLFVFMPTWWHVHIEAHETMQTHRMQIPAPICYIMFTRLYYLYCCCGHRPTTTRLNQMNKNIKGTNRMRLFGSNRFRKSSVILFLK